MSMRTTHLRILTLVAFFLCASSAYASVLINEIAWMGTTVSGTDEWIELTNTGASAVDLTGWHLDATDGSPSITLSGSIAGNGYYLIERTDDDTVPGIAADLVTPFGSGLGNGGETLLLKNANGDTIDTVIGGDNWENVGGDNTTKETAQRDGGNWITATGTPRAQNAHGGSVGEVLGASTESTPTDTSGATSAVSSSGASMQVSVYPRKNITVYAGDDQRVFVGYTISFTGNATGLYDEALPYATYRWNFGDGATAEGRIATHAYTYSGEYVVTLEVYNGNFHQEDRLTVTASDPSVIVTRVVAGNDGYVEIANHAGREIDLSGWRLSDGAEQFVFPNGTILLSARTVIFPNKNTGLTFLSGSANLKFPDGTNEFHFDTQPVTKPSPTPTAGRVMGAETIKPERTTSTAAPSQSNTHASSPSVGESNDTATSSTATVLWSRDGGASIGGYSQNAKWMFLFTGLALIVLAVIVIARSRVDVATAADEYAIIEDIIEGDEK